MVTLNQFAASDTDYINKLNANFQSIESELNNLANQITSAFGDGALLITDLWDRDGIVGPQSYFLDVAAYAGGSTIVIGRRPAYQVLLGEQNVSIAWITSGGRKARVTQTGDVTLNATSVTQTGLPKTIYVIVGSSGTAQFTESPAQSNVLYLYSMTWNGFTLTNIQRMAHILPHYTLAQELARPQVLQVHDGETDFLKDLISRVPINFHGASDDNLINLELTYEIVGGFVAFHNKDGDGLMSAGGSGVSKQLTLELVVDLVKWNLDPIVFDANSAPNTIHFRIDPAAAGIKRFVTEVEEVRLRRASVGPDVVSARGFTFGLFVRPVMGSPVPKDQGKVVMV